MATGSWGGGLVFDRVLLVGSPVLTLAAPSLAFREITTTMLKPGDVCRTPPSSSPGRTPNRPQVQT